MMKTKMTVIALVLLGCTAGQPESTAYAASEEQAEDRTNLRVMSFNIRYDNPRDGEDNWQFRKDNVITTVRDYDPDVLGLQEALAHQHDFFLEELDDYDGFGVGRNDGYRDNEYVTVMWKRDRFEKRTGGHFWLSETPHVPGSRGWDARWPRMVSWVWLHDTQTGRDMAVLNTHWDHRGDEAREQSARLMREFIAGLDDELPVLAVGDFNRTETQNPWRVMTQGREGYDDRELVDTYRAVYPERDEHEATGHGFEGRTRGMRIDWILSSTDFEVIDADIDRRTFDGRYPSDHYPVTADLYLSP